MPGYRTRDQHRPCRGTRYPLLATTAPAQRRDTKTPYPDTGAGYGGVMCNADAELGLLHSPIEGVYKTLTPTMRVLCGYRAEVPKRTESEPGNERKNRVFSRLAAGYRAGCGNLRESYRGQHSQMQRGSQNGTPLTMRMVNRLATGDPRTHADFRK